MDHAAAAPKSACVERLIALLTGEHESVPAIRVAEQMERHAIWSRDGIGPRRPADAANDSQVIVLRAEWKGYVSGRWKESATHSRRGCAVHSQADDARQDAGRDGRKQRTLPGRSLFAFEADADDWRELTRLRARGRRRADDIVHGARHLNDAAHVRDYDALPVFEFLQ